ncbi:prolyl 4-hydroxylase subunit alpha-2-like [Nilaparvata lugens]|uniref:prolyl 4-hydroxylase subunit alpha-2-like n=1 Tax=Nilaparvata lugens TaxID=108931 RepID=UPI00193D0B63|nr:prolyl 4-hydroxylase subunit alpha-2-like [Nilaparvata lugens]
MHVTVFLLVSAIGMVYTDLFTAMVELEQLLETESVLIRTLDDHISSTKLRLSQLRRQAAEYSKQFNEASVDVSTFLSNPINAYQLVKRLANDWKLTESLMVDSAEEERQQMTQYRQQLKFPTVEDVVGAATALMRLQDTYQLDTASIAQGQLNGVQYTTQLSSDDCFELGRHSYNGQDYYHAELWMSESLKRHNHEQNSANLRRWEILEYLAYSTYMQGKVQSALQLTDELLAIIPTHQYALSNRTLYQAAIGKAPQVDMDDLPGTGVYEMLCRKALSPSPQVLAHLKCRYVHKNDPFLRIGPLKEEDAYLDPRIVLYRDVIYEGEIEVMKKIASPRLERAQVGGHKGKPLVTNYRISKSCSLNEDEHPIIKRLSRRMEHITSLTMDTAEPLQVINYGIGGYYFPHLDFSYDNSFADEDFGNRIATVLFYMSDVAQGGATVFPSLELALWPEKGSAAFWYNLHPSGEGDLATRHAACPVLTGSKWIASTWIHLYGQEFRRPCLLQKEVRNTTSWYS